MLAPTQTNVVNRSTRRHILERHNIMSMSPQEPDLELTFLSTNQDHTLDKNHLDQTCPLDFGKHSAPPIRDLGNLEQLPYELIADTLAQLDLQTLCDFRRVNRRAMQAVDGMPQFKQIAKHNKTTLQAMLSTGTASRLSCIDILRTLETRDCESCGDFAGYIYLLSCSRVCFLCFTRDPRYLPLGAVQVWRRFGLENSKLSNLPQMNSLPGRYSPAEKLCRNRLTLYDYDSAQQAGITLHGSQAAMDKFTADDLSRKMDDYQRRNTEYLKGASRTKPRKPAGATEAFDMLETNAYRFMAVVCAPWIRPKEGLAVQGFHCRGCEDKGTRPYHWRRQYTNETFSEHVRQCGPIRKDERVGKYRHYPL